MPTQPARPQAKPQPKKKSDNEQNIKKYAIIGFGSVAAFALGFFALNKLMVEERGGSKLLHMEATSQPVKKEYVDDTPVTLLPRPLRLFDDYVKAIQRNDMNGVRRLSELEDAKLELLMTEERIKIVTDALQSKRITMTDKIIDGQTARVAAIFANTRGFDIMELALIMQQHGGPEDWRVTGIEDRWFSTSGKMPESRTVALGANRAAAASPLKDPSTFNKMAEAEPKQVDWLPGTSDAQKAEIERHIRDLFDTKNPAKLSTASAALVTIGKNAIPKLLSEFVSLDLKKEDDIIRGNSVDRTLAAMTFIEMGFDPAAHQSFGAIPPNEGRMRAIRRWFGWWEKNKDSPLPTRAGEEK